VRYAARVSLGDRIIERVETASLDELARAEFLDQDDAHDAGDAPIDGGDAERVASAIEIALAKKNQFVASEPKVAAAIRAAAAALFAELAAGASRRETFAKHAVTFVTLFREHLGDVPREVTSATYSPELQLTVLGLSPEAMLDPILDVGCGPDASLVRFLRAAKKDARGLDREAPLDAGERGDWLAFEYGSARWGTVLSHLGFSLHFMHQEMKASDLAFDYARAYMRVLRSLAPGGTFAYVPGLPFIESMLPPGDFTVKRVPMARELLTDNVARVQEATGLVLDAASHVIRRM
jgi:hypothetical protein